MLSDPEKKLPPTSDLYDEIETSKRHGGWWVWTRHLTAQERGMLMAHELHRSMREHYFYDVGSGAGEKVEKPKPVAPWDRYRSEFMNRAKG